MKRNTSCILAASALVMASLSLASAAEGEYYCPPGAKFCPAPGAPATAAAADTNFGIGGQSGTASPAPLPAYPRDAQLAYAAPQQSAAGQHTQGYTQPYQQQMPQQSPVLPAQSRQAQAYRGEEPSVFPAPTSRMGRNVEPASEVANQTSRKSRKERSANNEKVPWWKGGMWRNKKDGDQERDSSNTGSRTPPPSSSYNDRTDRSQATGGPRRMADDESMWDDDEYSGYNSDGSFGRPAAQGNGVPPTSMDDPFAAPQQTAAPYDNFGAQPQYDNFGAQAPYGAPAPAPYGGPQYPPAQQPMNTGGFMGDPYAAAPAPNYGQPYPAGQSPYPANPYPPSSVYSDPYGTVPTYTQPAYSDPYGAPTGSYDPYAPASTGFDAGSQWGSPAQATDPWGGMPAPTFQGTPSVDAQGSPQFENAVRMVKENRFSEAKSILASETTRNPGNAAAWRWLADCHYNLLELDDAIACYQQAMDRDSTDYYALRGQGFSYLHRGHEFWRRMQDEVGRGQKDQAAATFAQAHENYKKSLEILGMCLRRAPNDGEAIYGEAMAAEGASRKLYSNAISYLKLGPDQRERAELFAENCITVINKGIERSKERAKQNPGDAGPRALLGGLHLRKAILYHQLSKNDLALIELRNSRDVQQSILDEIDKNNEVAKKNLRECETYWKAWGGDNI